MLSLYMSTHSYPERTWVKLKGVPCITFQHGDTCTELIETMVFNNASEQLWCSEKEDDPLDVV